MSKFRVHKLKSEMTVDEYLAVAEYRRNYYETVVKPKVSNDKSRSNIYQERFFRDKNKSEYQKEIYNRSKEDFVCDCGKTILNKSKKYHLSSKQHAKLLKIKLDAESKPE